MKFIAAVDENWGIGHNGKLLTRISADQKFFKQTTMGHVVILGRKTLEEFPGGKPLQGRINIILSHNKEYAVEGAIVVHSIEELFDKVSGYDSDELYVIGGESVYQTLIPYCDTGIVTKIHYAYEADAFIPNLDEMDGWNIMEEGEMQEANGIFFHFCQYQNLKCKKFE